MGMFGTQYSKFVSGSNTVLFEHSNIIPSYFVGDYVKHESVLTGFINYVNLKDVSKFEIDINLFKYENPDYKFNEIMEYRNKLVNFYPHYDGEPIKNIYNEPVDFKITEIIPYYLTQDSYYDAVKLIFKSSEYVYYGNIISNGYGYNYGIQYGVGF